MESIENIVVRDEEQEEARLGDLWAERPAVLVFIRHFG